MKRNYSMASMAYSIASHEKTPTIAIKKRKETRDGNT